VTERNRALDPPVAHVTTEDPVARLAALKGSRADIKTMLAEIEAGRH
jgi:hypothetical protein